MPLNPKVMTLLKALNKFCPFFCSLFYCVGSFVFYFFLFFYFNAGPAFSYEFYHNKKSIFSRSNIAFAPVDEIIVKDINNNGKNEIICVRRNLDYFTVLDDTGKKIITLQNNLCLVTDLDSDSKCEFLVISSRQSKLKTLTLIDHEFNLLWKKEYSHVPDYRLKDPSLFLPFKFMVFDVDRDNIAEIAVIDLFSEKTDVISKKGLIIGRHEMLEYLPNLMSDYDPVNSRFIISSSVFQRGDRFYLDLFGQDRLVYYKRDKNNKKWLKEFPVYDQAQNLLWTFKMDRNSYSPSDFPHFFRGVDVIDFNNDKSFDIILGGDNRIFIISSKGKLIKTIKNIFY
jgi:hypothetical protein